MSARRMDVAPPKFYDVQEVAEILKVSRMTIYRAINSGELRAVKIRGRLLVPARVIEMLVSAAAGEDGTP